MVVDASLKQALDAMKTAERSAVVVRSPGGISMFKAGIVVQGLAQGKETLADLSARETSIHSFGDEEAAAIGGGFNVLHDLWRSESQGLLTAKDFTRLTSIRSNLDNLFQGIEPHYISGPSDSLVRDLAAVVSRNEYVGAPLLSAPPDCYCTNPACGDDPHPYNKPIPANGLCILDGWKIVCS